MGWRREPATASLTGEGTSLTDEEVWLRAVIAEIGSRALVRLVDADEGRHLLVEVPGQGSPAEVLILRTAS